ncbi:small integral membrane protein 11-like [Lampetra fluviatilis]
MLVESKALENFPLLMYILAAKSLLLCLGFVWAKSYQRKRVERQLRAKEQKRE